MSEIITTNPEINTITTPIVQFINGFDDIVSHDSAIAGYEATIKYLNAQENSEKQLTPQESKIHQKKLDNLKTNLEISLDLSDKGHRPEFRHAHDITQAAYQQAVAQGFNSLMLNTSVFAQLKQFVQNK